MPLEHYKTQVLLLHSEQTTLDNLSAGFNDRYTVHCATSGTEALNTLGETPIHVIVSAQDLPGMSGVEALREAKRRSPETIGILLAGNKDQGLEALVGDKEIFQVVRGRVTAEDLSKLVDNATQQMRLMALAESANDTAADVDVPTSQHIVMETSEHGSTIISDGSARLPALDPQKVSASVSLGTQGIDVLVLTKDDEFLETIKESSRGLHNVHYANTLKQAEDAVNNKKVGVAVVDAGMIGEKVEKLTQHLRGLQPRLVCIVAGRRDDGEMLMDLINRGKVYRFLLKPVSPGRARLAVEASVKHHLEAPDSAFKLPGKPGHAAKPKAKARPAAENRAKTAAAAKTKPASAAPATPATPAAQPEKPASKTAQKVADSPVADGLSDAFGDGDTSFTETMTGIVTSVGKSISDIREKVTGGEPEPTSAPDSDGTDGGTRARPVLLGAGALGLVSLVAAGFWMFGGSGQPVEQPTGQQPVETAAPETARPQSVTETEIPAVASTVDTWLDEARLARDSGRIFNPPEDNAIELYLQAAAADPGDATIGTELAEVITQALSMAEAAILERRVDDAAAALSRVSLAEPDHPRLPFLTAQVQEMQFRAFLDEARIAIRDSRFEDAAQLISSARALDASNLDALAAVEQELQSARSAQQVDSVLERANARLEEGNLIAPANDNARYYYELVLSNDPDNAAARQGLTAVGSKLVLRARAEIDAGNFSTAEAILADARRVDPSSAELAASSAALEDARQRVIEQRRQAEAERQAAAERDAANRRAAERLRAERQAALQATLTAGSPTATGGAGAQAAPTAGNTADAGRDGLSATQTGGQTASPLAAAGQVGSTGANPAGSSATVPERAAVAASRSEPPRQQTPIGISSLTRTKYVAPKYPRSAERRGLSGWVDVIFTVTPEGTVGTITIRESEPEDVFVNAATRAVERWEFEPVIENGVAVEKRVGVRLMFAIE